MQPTSISLELLSVLFSIGFLSFSLYTDVDLFFFSLFWKTSACARKKNNTTENKRHERLLTPLCWRSINPPWGSPMVYFLSRALDGIWRENRGSVNRLPFSLPLLSAIIYIFLLNLMDSPLTELNFLTQVLNNKSLKQNAPVIRKTYHWGSSWIQRWFPV